MSAVAQRALSSPATLRSQSVGRRSPGSGTTMPALRRRPPPPAAARSAASAGAPAGRRQHVVVEERRPTPPRPARQPALRAAAGPRAAAAHHAARPSRQRRSGQRSAGRRGGRPPRSPRPAPGRRPSSRRPAGAAGDGRPTSGSTMAAGASRVTTARRRTRNGPMASSVDRRGAEALQRVARVVDHRAPGRVEAGVDHDRHAGARARTRSSIARHQRLVGRGRRSGSARCRRRARRPGCRSRHSGRTRCVKSMYGARQRAPSKISARPLGQHHRRDRPELLAALDVVEPLEVRRPPRVGQQRAVAERPRAELAAALEPGDDAVGGEHLGHRVGDVVGPLDGHAGASQPAPPAPSSSQLAAERRRRPSARTVVAELAATCSAAPSAVPGVARRRAAPRPRSNGPSRRQPRVGHAVERHAAGHHQARSPVRSCSQRASSSSTSSSRGCTLRGEVGVRGGQLARPAAARGASAPSRAGRRGSRRRRSARTSLAERVEEAAAARRRPSPSPCTRRSERRKPRCAVSSS